MKRNNSQKLYWQHLAKLANCKNETEKITEQIQYLASIGVSDCFYTYEVKRFAKSIKSAKDILNTNGFIVEDERSNIKGKAILHISWGDANKGIAHTFKCMSNQVQKDTKLKKDVFTKVEEAAKNGEYSLVYDLVNVGITDVDVVNIEEMFRETGEFSKVSTDGTKLTLEWRI